MFPISKSDLRDYEAPLKTPMAPRGKPSDITEKDLEEFRASFSDLLTYDDVVDDELM